MQLNLILKNNQFILCPYTYFSQIFHIPILYKKKILLNPKSSFFLLSPHSKENYMIYSFLYYCIENVLNLSKLVLLDDIIQITYFITISCSSPGWVKI